MTTLEFEFTPFCGKTIVNLIVKKITPREALVKYRLGIRYENGGYKIEGTVNGKNMGNAFINGSLSEGIYGESSNEVLKGIAQEFSGSYAHKFFKKPECLPAFAR